MMFHDERGENFDVAQASIYSTARCCCSGPVARRRSTRPTADPDGYLMPALAIVGITYGIGGRAGTDAS